MQQAADQLAQARQEQVNDWKRETTSELDQSIQEMMQLSQQERQMANAAQQQAQQQNRQQQAGRQHQQGQQQQGRTGPARPEAARYRRPASSHRASKSDRASKGEQQGSRAAAADGR